MIIGAIGVYLYFFSGAEPTRQKAAPAADFPYTFIDDSGRRVRFTAAPFRAVSLSPSLTEVLFELGLGDRVVGTDDDSDHPSGALGTLKVGTLDEPDLGALASAAPQVVFAGGRPQDSSDDALIARHAPLVAFRVETLNDVYRSIDRIGRIMDRGTISDELIKSLKAREQAVTDQLRNKKEISVYIELPAAEKGRTDITFLSDLLKRAKARSVFPGGEPSFGATPAAVLDQISPQAFIILDPAISREDLEGRPGWSALLDKNGVQLILASDIDPITLLRPGPRGVLALERLHEYLRPVGIGRPQG